MLAVYVMAVLTGLGIGVVAPSAPLLLKEAGASGFGVGLAATLMSTGMAIAALATGRWVDRTGPRPAILTGAVVYSLSLAAFPWVGSVLGYHVLRTIEGMGMGMLFVSLEAAMNRLVPKEQRGRATGIYGFAFGVGVALGPLVGIAALSRPELAFSIASVGCLAAALIGVPRINVHGPAPHVESESSAGLLKLLWAPVVAVGAHAICEVALVSLGPVYFAGLGLQKISIAGLVSLYTALGVVAPLVAGRISDRVGRMPVLLGCGVLLGAGAAVAAPGGAGIDLVLATALLGSASGAIYPVALGMLGDRVPAERLGAAGGLLTTALAAGSITGPIAAGAAMDLAGPRTLFAIVGGSAIVMIAVLAAAFLRERRPEARALGSHP